MDFEIGEGDLRITPAKLPKHGRAQGLKYGSRKANQTIISGRYNSKWYFMQSPLSMEDKIIEAATWWNTNAQGEWQYRAEHAYAKIHDKGMADDEITEIDRPGSFYYQLIMRHFIHYTLDSDILIFKLSVP